MSAKYVFDRGQGFLALGSSLNPSGLFSANNVGYAAITLRAKNVTISTSSGAVDAATIAIPSGITRWRPLMGGTIATTLAHTMITETSGGGFGINISAYDAPNAGGLQILAAVAPNGSAGSITNWLPQNTTGISTSSTIYIRQSGSATNAGTVSFYITIQILN